MSSIKARAIVIKEKVTGEASVNLTLLAKDIGKINVSAKGAKNQKSKFQSGAQIFCYSDFMLYEGKGFLTVSQIDVIRNFTAYYDDIFKMAYGAYFLELIDKSVMLSQESNEIMLLLLKCLKNLEKAQNPKLTSVLFQFRLFDLLGCGYDLECCPKCGAEANTGNLYFSDTGGFMCNVCKERGSDAVAPDVRAAAIRISKADSIPEMLQITLPQSVVDGLHKIAESIVKNQLEISVNSLELIKIF